MSNKVTVSTTTNTVTITPQQNTGVSIGTTNTPITVNQGSTSVVQIQAPGVKGNAGPAGPIGPQGPTQDTGSLLTTASYSNPNLTLTKGDGSTFNVGISTITPTLAEVTAQGSSTTTAITASTISASERITAVSFIANDPGNILSFQGGSSPCVSFPSINGVDTFQFGDNTTPNATLITGTNVRLDGPVTASGNISASGEFRASTINLVNTDKLVSTGSEGKVEISSGSLKIYDDDESHFFFTTDSNNAVVFKSDTIGDIMALSLASNKIEIKQPTGFGSPSSINSFERVVIKALGTVPSRNCFRVTDSSNNTFFKISDNSKIRLGDDGIPTASLDIVGDLRVSTNITASGNISSSGTGSFAQISLPDLPTADPGIAGRLFTTQSTGTGGNLEGQKILLVSAG